MDDGNGGQKAYDHLQTVDTGKCNLTKCIDGKLEEEFKFPYMVYCEKSDPGEQCQVISSCFIRTSKLTNIFNIS